PLKNMPMDREPRAGEFADLFELDSRLDRLVRKIELLTHLNPQNIEKEKKRFFASKYNVEPEFKYPKVPYDPFGLHRQFYTLPLDRIRDGKIQTLYRDTIQYYSNLVQCIETIGLGRNFYFNSLRVYGTPTEKDVENARFILHFTDLPDHPDTERKYSA